MLNKNIVFISLVVIAAIIVAGISFWQMGKVGQLPLETQKVEKPETIEQVKDNLFVQIGNMPGMVFIDADETRNVIVVGVEKDYITEAKQKIPSIFKGFPVEIQTTKPICTLESKICPDGSEVGRNPDKNCEFYPCPGEIDTLNWKTYRNEEYGFEVRYPPNWVNIGRYITEPQLRMIFDISFGDPENQFRTLRIFVYDEIEAPKLDRSSGEVFRFPGGSGIRIGNAYFFTEKDKFVIQLWHTNEKDRDEFFSQILSTFKFIK